MCGVDGVVVDWMTMLVMPMINQRSSFPAVISGRPIGQHYGKAFCWTLMLFLYGAVRVCWGLLICAVGGAVASRRGGSVALKDVRWFG